MILSLFPNTSNILIAFSYLVNPPIHLIFYFSHLIFKDSCPTLYFINKISSACSEAIDLLILWVQSPQHSVNTLIYILFLGFETNYPIMGLSLNLLLKIGYVFYLLFINF